LARKESNSPFLGSKPAIPISHCVGRLIVKEWLQERHCELQAAVTGMRHSKLFIGRTSDKLPGELMALDRKEGRMVTGLLTGYYILRRHLHIMGLPEQPSAGKCGQEGESPYRILCQFIALV
jgi:hypothetical protein